jgi:hypothetical protein
MRRLLATVFVTAVAALAGITSATAAPPLTVPERLCTFYFGEFGVIVPGTASGWFCAKPGGTSPFTESEISLFRALCEGAYGGLFILSAENHAVNCHVP